MKYKYEIAPGTYPTLEEELELERWSIAVTRQHWTQSVHASTRWPAKTYLKWEIERSPEMRSAETKIHLGRAAE